MARMETGPFKPEGDWTGYFIRGDNAMGWWSHVLRQAAIMLDDPKDIYAGLIASELRAMVAELAKVNERGEAS